MGDLALAVRSILPPGKGSVDGGRVPGVKSCVAPELSEVDDALELVEPEPRWLIRAGRSVPFAPPWPMKAGRRSASVATDAPRLGVEVVKPDTGTGARMGMACELRAGVDWIEASFAVAAASLGDDVACQMTWKGSAVSFALFVPR